MPGRLSFSLSLALMLTPLAGCAHAQNAVTTIAPPDAAIFGGSLEAMTPVFEESCESYEVRELDPAVLPIAENSHVQVDCRGLSHAGGDRLAEFVFADDSLVFLWVLTTSEEEAVLVEQLRAMYGEPTHETPTFFAFADDLLALRRDVPELLYYSQDVAPLYRGWFDQSAAADGEGPSAN